MHILCSRTLSLCSCVHLCIFLSCCTMRFNTLNPSICQPLLLRLFASPPYFLCSMVLPTFIVSKPFLLCSLPSLPTFFSLTLPTFSSRLPFLVYLLILPPRPSLLAAEPNHRLSVRMKNFVGIFNRKGKAPDTPEVLNE